MGTLEQILCGPSAVADGSLNLIGALRRTMAISGYSDLKEFQRAIQSQTVNLLNCSCKHAARTLRRLQDPSQPPSIQLAAAKATLSFSQSMRQEYYHAAASLESAEGSLDELLRLAAAMPTAEALAQVPQEEEAAAPR